jgi:uncharacterized protein (TIGR03437 family)
MSNCPGAQSSFLTKLSPSGGLVYSTYFGHSNETAVAVAVDSNGRAYIAGDTVDQCTALSGGNAVGPAVCFPTTANAVLPGSTFNTTVNPSNDNQGSAFISVFDAAGANLLYSSLFGGTGNQAVGNGHPTYGSGVAVDASGYFYLVGTTGSNELPVTKGAFQTTYYGNPTPGYSTATRGFVAKFNPVSSGASLFYTTYLGGTDPTQLAYQDFVSGIAVDAAGDAYVSGNASYDFPVTAGAYDTTPCPYTLCENRNFLAKLNPAGSALVWATFAGNPTNPTLSAADTISPPRLDSNGNVYVAGVAGDGMEVPLVNPLQPANEFAGMYVTMYNPTGSAIGFSTVIYNTTNNSQVVNGGVDVDSQGNIYVAGITSATSLPVTAGAFQPAANGPAGTNNAFIAKINTSAPVPTVKPGGIVPVYSSVSAVQTGEWVSIYGANLATETASWNPGTFPTQLGGTSVTIDGKLAYLWYVSPTQINLQVPNDTTIGSVPVVITTASGVAYDTVTLASVAPSFSLLDSKHVAGIISRSDGSGAYGNGTYDILGPTGTSLGYPTVAAKAGDNVVFFGVGFGPTTPTVSAGALFTGAASTNNPVTLSINNMSVTPLFAGESSAGLYQLNIVIPSGLGTGDVPLQASVAGAQTQSTVVISLK